MNLLDALLKHAYDTRGAAYLAAGDYDRAITDLEKALDIDPDFKVAQDRLIEARSKLSEK